MNTLFNIEEITNSPKKKKCRTESEYTKFKKMMYGQYCTNMKEFGREPEKYRSWLKTVDNSKFDN